MLSDQIHNQTDKILDLERTLDSKKEALKKTEDLLQIEMINRWRRNTWTNRMVDRFWRFEKQLGWTLTSRRVETE